MFSEIATKASVFIADDHPIVLAGLSMLIKAENDLELAGQATNGADALNRVRELRPLIAVLDISLPEMDGICVTRQLQADCPATGILILTQHEDRANLRQALDAGARGYVLKKSAASSLVNAIRGVLVGGLYVDPSMAGYVFQPPSAQGRRKSAPLMHLTGRETEVLKLVASGMKTKEIAEELDVSMSSIETYKARASEKLNIKSRAQIIRFASSQGWLASL